MQAVQRKTEYYSSPAPPKKRVVKIEGNVAYISTGSPKKKVSRPSETAAGKRISPQVKKSVRPAAAVKPAPKDHAHAGLASTIIVIFVAFCALALLVSRYAAVCIIDSENNKIKGEIASIEARVEELKADMELQSDLEHVRDTAINKLGMVYPDQSQKLSIDMS